MMRKFLLRVIFFYFFNHIYKYDPPVTLKNITIDFGGIFQAFGDGAGGKIKSSAAFGAGGECLSISH